MLTYLKDLYSVNTEYIIYLFSFTIFAVVSVMAFVVARRVTRLREIRGRAHNPSVAATGTENYPKNVPRNANRNAVSAAFAQAATRFAPGHGSTSAKAIRDDLIQAGLHGTSALAWYYFARIVFSLMLPAIGFPIVVMTGVSQTTFITAIILIILALIGMIIPSVYIMYRKRKLASEYRDGFPEVMDLMVVCTEAGVSLNAALNRVAKEIAKTHRNLGINLHIMTLELRAGRSLTEAFDSLAHRVTIDEVRSLGSLLQQSESLGTSLTDALRTYSKEMREKRFFRAEEKAYSLPAKMVIPLGLFVFPVMLVVIMLPLLIRMHQGFMR